jgi:hypothetical protein
MRTRGNKLYKVKDFINAKGRCVMKIKWENIMKVKFIFVCLISVFILLQGVAMAVTGDVIDDFLFYGTACEGYANAVWADVDNIYNGTTYGNYETMVVFWTITAEAYPVNEFTPPGKWYYLTPVDTQCGGTEPWDRARVVVRFVDMLAAGFDQTNPDTWVYKDINSVSIKTSHDYCVATDKPYSQAYMSVLAYDEIEQNGVMAGTRTGDNGWLRWDFASTNGIKELYITSDFCENNLDDLILDYVVSCTDNDGDTFSPEGSACGLVDCDDNDPARHH